MNNLIRSLIFTLCLMLSSPSFICGESPDRPLSVLIIGGGPAGLATAIEANKLGAHITIVEKRAEYSRIQRVFLLAPSLQLLDEWNAETPNLNLFDAGEYGKIGFVAIKDLEKGLQTRVETLGIEIFYGTFEGFLDEHAVVSSVGGVQLLDYDIIVAADGVHSTTRDALGIDCNCFGTAVGSYAYLDLSACPGPLDLSLFMIQKDHYLRKITMPQASVIFWQSYFNLSTPFAELSQEQLVAEARSCGWEKEALLIEQGCAFRTGNIDISLQQAQSFSDRSRRAILVGDAAACGSFFHGNGANTALKTASIAGEFFKMFLQNNDNAYDTFDQSMKKTTDELIDYSRPLLDPEVAKSFTG